MADPATMSAISLALSAFGLFQGLGASGRRKKRERKQIGTLKEQYEDVLGRIPGVTEFFGGLEDITREGFELEEESLSRKFIDESFQLGVRGEEAQSQTGLQRSGALLSEIDRQKSLGREGFAGEIGNLRLSETGEMIRIGKARETELQDIQDILFRLETEIEGRGGSLGDSKDPFDAFGGFVSGLGDQAGDFFGGLFEDYFG